MTEFIDVLTPDGLLHPDVLKARRFVANGIRFDNVDGEQCIADSRNIAYLGMMALVRPSRFLAVTPPDHIMSTEYMMATEIPYGSPFLEVRIPPEEDDVPYIREHEGRSRMSAIMHKHGDVPVPVCVFFNMEGYALRAREIEPEWIERVAAGVIRERRGTPPEWVPGSFFEQLVYMEKGRRARHFDYRSQPASETAFR
ncbi:hypothetical protein D3C71_290390 [compost metagenome]